MRGGPSGDFASWPLAKQPGVCHPQRHRIGVALRDRRAKVSHAKGKRQGIFLSEIEFHWRAFSGPKRRQGVQALGGHQACVDAHPLNGGAQAAALEVVPAPAFAFVGVAKQTRFDESRQVMVERGRGQPEVIGQLPGIPCATLVEQDVFTEQAVNGRGATSVSRGWA